jgi:hypothetical protein
MGNYTIGIREHVIFPETADEDIKDVFAPITDIFHGAIASIGLKVYGTDDNGDVIKDTLVFI